MSGAGAFGYTALLGVTPKEGDIVGIGRASGGER